MTKEEREKRIKQAIKLVIKAKGLINTVTPTINSEGDSDGEYFEAYGQYYGFGELLNGLDNLFNDIDEGE